MKKITLISILLLGKENVDSDRFILFTWKSRDLLKVFLSHSFNLIYILEIKQKNNRATQKIPFRKTELYFL